MFSAADMLCCARSVGVQLHSRVIADMSLDFCSGKKQLAFSCTHMYLRTCLLIQLLFSCTHVLADTSLDFAMIKTVSTFT